jgi:hypothetical protein
MPSFLDRLLGVLIAEDEAVNAALGGDPRETISGTVGRACGLTVFGERRWWGAAARWVVDAVMGKGHCELQAEKEARRRGS